ncbi:hypothetical protein AYO20_07721 [Fonsecaea nubica]|uniref:Protein kinase domain-containing protein n=1 Tax=Fonsecaea nubica TaxID=856822 RepID=A0A178CV20_9EURO|nr:hypothetical protein AYO20_07721 [Fonsecaea nubica]OAL32765.1 hypothetical protein AYO20_07721 [Fonsecaea nubica]
MVDNIKLLMIGTSSEAYRIGNKVAKICHVLPDDPAITQQNLEACQTEALVYQILGEHPRIVRCLSWCPSQGRVELEFYPNGNLKDYLEKNYSSTTEVDEKRWAIQMIESVFYLHSKGVRHGDLRLEQWLLDESNARLGDFNGSGFDAQPALGLKRRPALGLECSSHWLPRPDDNDSSEQTHLFALGSSLYELMAGQMPFAGLDDHTIETRYAQRIFPNTNRLLLRIEISRCWNQEFTSAGELLDAARNTLLSKALRISPNTLEVDREAV